MYSDCSTAYQLHTQNLMWLKGQLLIHTDRSLKYQEPQDKVVKKERLIHFYGSLLFSHNTNQISPLAD